jgi:hypothetical protein
MRGGTRTDRRRGQAMKKLVAVVVVVFAMAGFATTATASGPLLDVEGIGCGVIDRDGSGVVTDDSRLIVYASGKVTLRCIGEGTPGDNIVVFRGFECGLLVTSTTNSTNRIGKNGEIQLFCQGHVDMNGDAQPAAAGSVGAG